MQRIIDPVELESALSQYTGSEETYYRDTPIRIEYTQGVKFLQEQSYYWLIDAIASYQTAEFKQNNDFQFWKLIVDLTTQSATLTCDDGNENISATQQIPYTDSVLAEVRVWVQIDHKVFMFLPSEY
jgi:hypothetical protein